MINYIFPTVLLEINAADERRSASDRDGCRYRTRTRARNCRLLGEADRSGSASCVSFAPPPPSIIGGGGMRKFIICENKRIFFTFRIPAPSRAVAVVRTLVKTVVVVGVVGFVAFRIGRFYNSSGHALTR